MSISITMWFQSNIAMYLRYFWLHAPQHLALMPHSNAIWMELQQFLNDTILIVHFFISRQQKCINDELVSAINKCIIINEIQFDIEHLCLHWLFCCFWILVDLGQFKVFYEDVKYEIDWL